MSVKRHNEITGIGANVYDTLIKMPSFPVEDTKIAVETVRQSGGGPTATGLVAASKLGAKVSAIAVLSNDAGGKFLFDDLVKYGIDTELIDVREGDSFSATVILCDDNGSRTCLFNRGQLPSLELDDRKRAAIADADVFMVDGNELSAAIEGADIARSSGTKILYDAGGLYPGIEPLLERSDLLIPSAEFALAQTGKSELSDAVEELYNRYRPEIVVATNGKEGGLLFDGKKLQSYSAFPVEVVDSNGAGDVFHGAFAFAVTRKFDWMKCCIFAGAVAALKCTKLGARKGVPTYDETIRFIQKYQKEEQNNSNFKKIQF